MDSRENKFLPVVGVKLKTKFNDESIDQYRKRDENTQKTLNILNNSYKLQQKEIEKRCFTANLKKNPRKRKHLTFGEFSKRKH